MLIIIIVSPKYFISNNQLQGGYVLYLFLNLDIMNINKS